MLQVPAKDYLEQGSGTVTLCGSTKFFYEAMEANRMLTFMNWMVYQCGSWGHSYHKYAQPHLDHDYSVVKLLHFEKILNSDCIIVVTDSSGYYGISTKAEIAFAESESKPVIYYNGQGFTGTCMVKQIPVRYRKLAIDYFIQNYPEDTGIIV